MDDCIIALQKTIEAATDSATALAKANRRWDEQNRAFNIARKTWSREERELKLRIAEKDRLADGRKKEMKRLVYMNTKLKDILNAHLRNGCSWGEKARESDAGASADGNDETGLMHKAKGKASESSGVKGRESAVAVKGTLAPTVGIPAERRTHDRIQHDGNSSADEVVTPKPGSASSGHRPARHLPSGTPRSWPGVGDATAATRRSSGEARSGVEQPASGRNTTEIRLKEICVKHEMTTNGTHEPANEDLNGERQQGGRGSEDSKARNMINSVKFDLERPLEWREVNAERDTDSGFTDHNGNSFITTTRNVDENSSAQGESAGVRGTMRPHDDRFYTSSVPRLLSSRKRSRLELGEPDVRSAQEGGAGGGSRLGRRTSSSGSPRTVVVEIPQPQRRISRGSSGSDRRQYGGGSIGGKPETNRVPDGDGGPDTLIYHARQAMRKEYSSDVRSLDRDILHASRAGSSSGSNGRYARSSADFCSGEGVIGKGWMQPIDADSPPPSTLHLPGPPESGYPNGNRSSTIGNCFNRQTGKNTALRRRNHSGRRRNRTAVFAPLMEPAGHNRGDNLADLGLGADEAEVEDLEPTVTFPRLKMAVVSPKKRKLRRHSRQQEGSEVGSSKLSSPTPSRDGRLEREANAARGPAGHARKGGESEDFNGTAVERRAGAVGNPYHPNERGVSASAGFRGDKEQAAVPKPHKFQEVVRDRARRAAMKGHDCEHCMAYLAVVGGSPEERQAMLDMCSRHKHDEAHGRPAETPEGFWDLSFADSVCRKEREGEALPGSGGKQHPDAQSSSAF